MILVFLSACFVLSLSEPEGEVNTSLESGRIQYEILKRDAAMPKFGACWKNALEDLHSGNITMNTIYKMKNK